LTIKKKAIISLCRILAQFDTPLLQLKKIGSPYFDQWYTMTKRDKDSWTYKDKINGKLAPHFVVTGANNSALCIRVKFYAEEENENIQNELAQYKHSMLSIQNLAGAAYNSFYATINNVLTGINITNNDFQNFKIFGNDRVFSKQDAQKVWEGWQGMAILYALNNPSILVNQQVIVGFADNLFQEFEFDTLGD